MDTLTIVVAAVLLFFALRGAWHGLSGEVAPLVGLVVCGGTLWFGYKPLHTLAAGLVAEQAAGTAAFYSALGVVVAGMALFLVVSRLTRGVLGFIVPQPFNAILGCLVGAAKGFFLISVAASVAWMVRERAGRFQHLRENNPVVSAAEAFWADQLHALKGRVADVIPGSEEAADGGH